VVKAKRYIPDRGDLVWINFSPQQGHEQAGRRPAIVISPKRYNERLKLALFCPVTSKVKGYPFEVQLPEDTKVQGVVLCDQIKSLDWQARKIKFIEALPNDTLEEILSKAITLLE
jgi:mRNA interferase MazF